MSSNIDWNLFVIIIGIPLIFFLPVILMIMFVPTPSQIETERFKMCIEAQLEWVNGNCVEKKG